MVFNCFMFEFLLVSLFINEQFQKMDENKDGLVSRAEFLDFCMTDEVILKSLEAFEVTFWPEQWFADDAVARANQQVINHSSSSSSSANTKRNMRCRHHCQCHCQHKQQLNQQQPSTSNAHHQSNCHRSTVNQNSQPNNHRNQNCVVQIEPNRRQNYRNCIHNNNQQTRLQEPEPPALVRVRTWYTMTKQGVSC